MITYNSSMQLYLKVDKDTNLYKEMFVLEFNDRISKKTTVLFIQLLSRRHQFMLISYNQVWV